MLETPPSNKGMIIGTVFVAVIIFAGLVWAIMSAPPDGPENVQPESVTFNDEKELFQGKEDSKVVVHIYSDFQCPACRTQEPNITYAVDKYKDRVKFVWKDFPLSSIHPNARAAANAARCSTEQGKHWEFHKTLYDEQPSWSSSQNLKEDFFAYATRLGMDANAFEACYDARRFDADIEANVREGNANRVNGTPTVFVNDARLSSLTPADWDRVLTAALANNP